MSTPSNPAATSQLTLVLDRFDAAWQGNQPPLLTEFLAGVSTDAARRELLLELIPIDLEYRWRKYGPRPGSSWVGSVADEIAGLPRTPSLLHYSERLPELGPLENLPPALFAQEYRVRRQFGGWQGPADFEATYPTLGTSVLPLLVEMDRNLTVAPAARAADDPSRAPTFSIVQQSASLDTSANASGPAPSASRTIGPGTQLGEYRLIERLGKGGMGEVFKAEHRRMQRMVALKVLPPERVASPDAVQRFHREVVAISRLDHPNIVAAYDAREDHGVHYLVMKYVPGADLARLVKEQGPLSVNKAVAYMLQAARGLVYTHEHGVVHRDLKPANFLLADDGTIKILDLGLARLHIQSDLADQPDHSLTTDGDLMGTADFMAPEQALNAHKADARSDVYSLGCTLYYLLTGQRMYAGDTFMERVLAHQTQPIPSLSAALQKQSPGTAIPGSLESLNAIFHKLVAKAPAERYQSMSEIVAALELLRPADLPETALIRSPITKSTPRRSRWLEVIYGGVAVLALVIGLYVIYVNQRPKVGAIVDNGSPAAAVTSNLPPATQPPPIANGASSAPYVWPKDVPPPAVAPFNETKAKEHQEAWAKHLGVPVERDITLPGGAKLTMVLIPPGEFLMGSTDEERAKFLAEAKAANNTWAVDRIPSEGPQHRVQITQPFYLGKYEVTQAQWQAVMVSNPSAFKDNPSHPVEQVSWEDVWPFIAKLNDQSAPTGLKFVLPTEAQWEHACRAGSTTFWHSGDSAEALREYAWTSANAGGKTHPVGQLRRNGWGLYDMYGNVWEWCADWHANDYYGQSPPTDPSGPSSGSDRVRRGGTWFVRAGDCRSAIRSSSAPGNRDVYFGFRMAATIDVKDLVASVNDAPSLAIAPFDAAAAKEHQEAWAKHLGVKVEFENSIGMKFRLIPPGEFMMGSTSEEIEAALKAAGDDKGHKERIPTEAPRHKVTLTQPFYLGVNEVTQAQYQQVMGRNPAQFAATGARKDAVQGQDTSTYAVEMVNSYDATVFCGKLSELAAEKVAGRTYRLPTEAEWEFACRAGTTTKYWIGDSDELLKLAGWINANSGGPTHAVGELLANPFGLYDVHGNVWEWCSDWLGEYAISADNPVGPVSGSQRVLRGGSWHLNPEHARAAYRGRNTPLNRNDFDIGFRVVLSIDAGKASAAPPVAPPADSK